MYNGQYIIYGDQNNIHETNTLFTFCSYVLYNDTTACLYIIIIALCNILKYILF